MKTYFKMAVIRKLRDTNTQPTLRSQHSSNMKIYQKTITGQYLKNPQLNISKMNSVKHKRVYYGLAQEY